MDDLIAKRIYSMVHAEIRNLGTMRLTKATDEYWKNHDLEPPVKLTEEQLKQVNDFWGKYSFAYQNDPRIQEYFSYMSGRFDPRYCAEGLNAYYMFRFYDSPDFHTAFHDKNYRECLFGKENCSEALLRRIKGIWYDADYNAIGLGGAINAATEYLMNHEKLIVKPTPGGGGTGILFLRQGDSEKSISGTFAKFTKDDLIIEKIIKPHESYVLDGGSSVNTLRIITFLYNQEVTILAILFRMGCKGTEVDNFTQGGIACGVYADGTCMDYGFDDSGRKYDIHPDGFQFVGHKLYGVDKAIEFVKKLHFKIPMFKQMSWDVAMTEEGRPILVEMNPRGEAKIYQSVGALPFGEYTEQVLDEYLLLLFYKLGATWSWDYKEYCDHITLTSYGLDEEFVTVPASINGKTVTAMDKNCFQDRHPKKIVIPGCVKESSSLIIPKGAEVVWEEDKRGIVVLPPADLKAVYVDGHVELTWSSAPNSDNEVNRVTSYRIFRMEIGESRTYIGTVVASANSFRDFSMRPGTTYLYWICSHCAACNLTSDFTPGARVETIIKKAGESVQNETFEEQKKQNTQDKQETDKSLLE